MSLRIESAGPVGSALVRDYLTGQGRASEFFRGLPHDLAAFREIWNVRRQTTHDERTAVSVLLRPSSAHAEQRLGRFVEHGGAVVTTGQQTGLFTGPMYTIYKALSAVALARGLEEVLQTTVLPVFWCASEDHDWDEVNHAWIGPPTAGLRRIRVSSARNIPHSMARTPLPDDFESALIGLAEVVAGEEHSQYVLELVREAYQPDFSFAQGFRRLIERVLAPFDILTVDAADPRLKERSVPVLQDALYRAPQAEQAVSGRTRDLLAAGYGAQVPLLPGAANVFLEDERGRYRLVLGRRGWRTAAHPDPLPAEQLETLLAVEPERFSPNVLLRPVVESAVLPVLAYVAGPGEAAYFAQLGALFDLHRTPMPMVVPRASLVLVRDIVRETAAASGLDWWELGAAEHEITSRVARQKVPPTVRDALAALRASISSGYLDLANASVPLDASLAGVLGSSRNTMLLESQRAERKITAAVRRTEHERIRALLEARNELFPNGHPQERVLNILPFLARFGPSLLSNILAGISPPWAEP